MTFKYYKEVHFSVISSGLYIRIPLDIYQRCTMINVAPKLGDFERFGWGSNPRPLAWQASILTNWTTEPFIDVPYKDIYSYLYFTNCRYPFSAFFVITPHTAHHRCKDALWWGFASRWSFDTITSIKVFFTLLAPPTGLEPMSHD